MEKLFNNYNKIDLSENKIYYIFDDKENEKTNFVKSNEIFDLIVDTKNNLTFIGNERYIMNNTKSGIKKCDWIIFNYNNFYFIEAKSITEKDYRKNARDDAYTKFEHTKKFYNDNFKFNYNIKKYAILNFRVNTNDISKAKLKELKLRYKDILKLKYEETNILNL
ncbi:MAG: hypothetical protein ACOVQ2_02515 [Flavobacterium sp.]